MSLIVADSHSVMCGFGIKMSILSYPIRGNWGKSAYRGNCSGHVYKELFSLLTPKTFVDPMAGSFTSIEVANEMNIEAYGLDLHSGFNILRDSIIEVISKESDLVFSHPPYGGMIKYSGHVWGNTPHPDDLSHCIDDDDFISKLQFAVMNQRQATCAGGFYGVLIGDWRRKGMYSSYQAELIARMPKDELASVLIKTQHNTMSAGLNYVKQKLPLITHEYLLLWQRKNVSFFALFQDLALTQKKRLTDTWYAIVKFALVELKGEATLDQIYEQVFLTAPDKVSKAIHWKAKVRQILQSKGFHSCQRGIWSIV